METNKVATLDKIVLSSVGAGIIGSAIAGGFAGFLNAQGISLTTDEEMMMLIYPPTILGVYGFILGAVTCKQEIAKGNMEVTAAWGNPRFGITGEPSESAQITVVGSCGAAGLCIAGAMAMLVGYGVGYGYGYFCR